MASMVIPAAKCRQSHSSSPSAFLAALAAKPSSPSAALSVSSEATVTTDSIKGIHTIKLPVWSESDHLKSHGPWMMLTVNTSTFDSAAEMYYDFLQSKFEIAEDINCNDITILSKSADDCCTWKKEVDYFYDVLIRHSGGNLFVSYAVGLRYIFSAVKHDMCMCKYHNAARSTWASAVTHLCSLKNMQVDLEKPYGRRKVKLALQLTSYILQRPVIWEELNKCAYLTYDGIVGGDSVSTAANVVLDIPLAIKLDAMVCRRNTATELDRIITRDASNTSEISDISSNRSSIDIASDSGSSASPATLTPEANATSASSHSRSSDEVLIVPSQRDINKYLVGRKNFLKTWFEICKQAREQLAAVTGTGDKALRAVTLLLSTCTIASTNGTKAITEGENFFSREQEREKNKRRNKG